MLIPEGMATKTASGLGDLSPVETVKITNALKALTDVVVKHNKLKDEVTETLWDLSEKAGGLVIERVRDEMVSTTINALGRVIVIGTSIASLVLTPAGGLSVGVIGSIVGYLFVGGSKVYAMSCQEEHVRKLKDIYQKLETEVNRYDASKMKVFSELGKLGAFDAEKSFVENLTKIRAIVTKAEQEAKVFFPEIGKVIEMLKERYNDLPEDKKKNLNSKDFLAKMVQWSVGAFLPNSADIGTAAAGFLGDVLGGGSTAANAATPFPEVATVAREATAGAAQYPWFTTIHVLNIATNVGFLLWDANKIWELNEQRRAWNEDGEDRQNLLKNPKFEKEVKLRNEILKIRDEIVKGR